MSSLNWNRQHRHLPAPAVLSVSGFFAVSVCVLKLFLGRALALERHKREGTRDEGDRQERIGRRKVDFRELPAYIFMKIAGTGRKYAENNKGTSFG